MSKIYDNDLQEQPAKNSSIWTRADALKVNENDPTTTQPLVSADFPVMSDTVFIWDTMPLRDIDGKVLSVNGWSVIFTLTADREPENPDYIDANGNYDIALDWNNRHGRAKMCFWYSKTGKNWKFGGRVMKEGVSPTTREWAGSPILLNNQGEIDLYYTAVTPGATIVKVRGRITTSNKGVSLSDFTNVKALFEADGNLYQTEAQNPYWGFRDPFPFRDPKSGKLYMLFEGNVAGARGTHIVGPDEIGDVPPGYENVGNSRYQTGCVGIAEADDDNGDSWTLLPPLVTAVGVNDQTERPHFVFQDGKYYLFTISHKFTYGDGLTGPDGVYGFVSDEIFGPYVPLNGSALVLGNPPSQPFQTYSHYVMPNGLVTSFIDSVPADKTTTGMDYRIGGTEAPTVKIKIKGDRTFVVDEYDYGYIPPMADVILKA
ncbi:MULTISPECIES: glycoside hydrolase family 68 protein [Rahnella]|uniref:levansucrase n=1 Tax=Rahnella laticis TaxID=2787622 RepID=A0ABS0DZJ3_9GAMM|nr:MULTISPECIES: glycoside hydrolase family 68 protein [Rahnella]MBF7978211.1 glycoside hydrolase family 68 protein [Rahnella laticis]MBF7998072.1 glycoside hydrolase family 68 protein [Rahnella sp. LAC-M12]